MKKYDAIIIWIGKAGKTLAAELGNRGWNVAIIERSSGMYGGTGINSGCILRTVGRRVPPVDCREKGTDLAAA